MLTRRLRARTPRALLAAAAAAVCLPAAAHAAQPLSLVDDREPLGPGVVLEHEKYLAASGWVDRHILTAKLDDPAVSTDLLHAPKVAQGSALTTQANAAGAVAGVNGDFFDIGNSGAALGFEFTGGRLRKSGTRNGGQTVGVTRGGIGKLVNLALSAKATFDYAEHAISGYNQVGIPAGGIGAYTSEWGAYDRQTQAGGPANAANSAEVWIEAGKVTRAAQPPAAGVLPEGVTALVGREPARPRCARSRWATRSASPTRSTPGWRTASSSRSGPTRSWSATARRCRTASRAPARPGTRSRRAPRSGSRTAGGR